MQIEIEGIADLLADLKRIADGLYADDAQGIYTAAAGEIARDARRRAPVRTGLLRSAIRAKSASKRARNLYKSPAAYAIVGVRRGRVRAPHAHLVEFGSRGRAAKGDKLAFRNESGQLRFAKRVEDVPATGFFAKAVQSAGPRALAAAQRAHARLIQKLAK